ncbi:hypothetical protein PMAC_000709 [Pneumocystis sp. 'macacae']|nr:hypothetical protein PMAC_000709 [Pneumocystis sp. 'macacae']
MQRLEFDEVLPLEKRLKLYSSENVLDKALHEVLEEAFKENVSCDSVKITQVLSNNSIKTSFGVSVDALSVSPTSVSCNKQIIQELPHKKPIIVRPQEPLLLSRLRTFFLPEQSQSLLVYIKTKILVMPRVKTIDVYFLKSQQLLEAASQTTRISTKYRASDKAHLSIKTYDPVSGICIRFRTDRAVDVARLMAAACTLGHTMANTIEPQAETDQDLQVTQVQQAAEQGQGKRHKKRR